MVRNMTYSPAKRAVTATISTNPWVRQVHSVSRGSYGMSVTSRRVLFLAMVKVQKTGSLTVRIPMKEFLHVLNLRDTGRNRKNIIEAVDKLAKETIMLFDENGEWTDVMAWFSLISNKASEDGSILFEFNKHLEKQIRGFAEAFTTHYFVDYANLTGRHAQRLFEILMSFEGFAGKRGNEPGAWWCEFTVDELRDMLGIAPDKYPRNDLLRQRVIDPAVEEINAVIPGVRVVSLIERRREIIGWRFWIQKQHRDQPKKFNPAPATMNEETAKRWQEANPEIFEVKHAEELENAKDEYGHITSMARLAALGRAIERTKKTPGRRVPKGLRGRPPIEDPDEAL